MPLTIGEAITFANPKADKSQVVKIGEEYGEIYSAWEDWRETGLANRLRYASYEELHRARMHIVDECADCITAIANLLVALNVDDNQMQRAMEDCAQRNRDRGRL